MIFIVDRGNSDAAPRIIVYSSHTHNINNNIIITLFTDDVRHSIVQFMGTYNVVLNRKRKCNLAKWFL